jgi:hypothetical protein
MIRIAAQLATASFRSVMVYLANLNGLAHQFLELPLLGRLCLVEAD